MNTSGIEILSRQHNAEQRNISALQLRDRNALNFGLVLFKDRDELFVARILLRMRSLFVRAISETRQFCGLPPYSTTKWTQSPITTAIGLIPGYLRA